MREPVIIEQRGSHLLVGRSGRFAVVERRAGHIYSVENEARKPHPDSPAGIAAAVGPRGWGEEAEVRRLFEDLVQRGERLAQRLW
ncbi:MAG: hypothetical protein JWL84_4793 [Rhodospirillales bacterium]|jgi:hypothetical protein|nr:hypothetical protein [Rhodospirillales bacterium]